jgi:hypothetical protein
LVFDSYVSLPEVMVFGHHFAASFGQTASTHRKKNSPDPEDL